MVSVPICFWTRIPKLILFRKHSSGLKVAPSWLFKEAANGIELPYIGYFEATVEDLGEAVSSVLMLVKKNEGGDRVWQ